MELFKFSKDYKKLETLERISFDESKVEEFLIATQLEPLLGQKALIIGNQIVTSTGKKLDILALDQDGNLILVELKKGIAPREVIAQIIDYASWLDSLPEKNLEQMAKERIGKSVYTAFKEFANKELELSDEPILYIVASDFPEEVLNASTYLSNKDVPVICIKYEIFELNNDLYFNTIVKAGSQEREMPPGVKPVNVNPLINQDRRFFKEFRVFAEEKLGDWLDSFDFDQREGFSTYILKDGTWTSIYSNFKIKEYRFAIEIAMENREPLTSIIKGNNRKSRKLSIEFLNSKDVKSFIKELELEIVGEKNDVVAKYFEGLKYENNEDDFRNTLCDEFKKSQPLIEKLVSFIRNER
jgi:hypothetical protein